MLERFIFFLISIILILILSSTVSFAIPPSSNVIYEGIDVSNWQGYINYENVKASGIDIVYIKASQGSNIIDPFFKTNYTNAKNNGLKIGFYHFLTAKTMEEAINEADYFSSVISNTSPDCKLAMDFENFGSLSIEDINNISVTFLERVKTNTGKEVIIYSDAYNARNVFGKSLANIYPLWVAEYDVSSPTDDLNWSSWTRFSIYRYGSNFWN